MTACSTALAGLTFDWDSGNTGQTRPQSFTPTGLPNDALYFFGWTCSLGGSDIIGGTQAVALTGTLWTQIGAQWSNNNHGLSGAAYTTDDSPSAISADWGSIANPGYGRAVVVAVPTSQTAPLQSKVSKNSTTLALTSPATAGNLLLVFRMGQASAVPGAPSAGGYTQIGSALTATDGATLVCYAKCAAGGETTITTSTNDVMQYVVEVALTEDLPVAEFSWNSDETTAYFFDESTGTPTSWVWDFGDGTTSTSQNPTHIFAAGGSYSVTLTVTNAAGSDDVTHTVIVSDFELPEPTNGKATVEIYVHDPSGYRWDEANWDEAVWSSAGWVDVTPESIEATWSWGAPDASLGILALPDAARAAITFLDPDRTLDPSNADSPYFGDIVPLLPVRINLDGWTVRTGHAEFIGFAWDEVQRAFHRGYMRVTDNIQRMANADVPHDTTLADTLYARAVDALEASGLTDINVLPLADDPALVAWTDTGDDQSVWEWIRDAAAQVLYQPYIDRNNQLGFRPYATPYDRGKSVDDTELVDLQAIVTYSANYSVVRALDDPGPTVEERALTPTPAYGKRVYSDRQDKLTPNAGDWAQTVLEDRSLSSLRWVPGEIYTTAAPRTRYMAEIESVERFGISNLSTDPIVAADTIVLGGTIRLEAESGRQARWWFTFEAAQTAELPLWDSESDPPEFLEATGGGQFLYRSL